MDSAAVSFFAWTCLSNIILGKMLMSKIDTLQDHHYLVSDAPVSPTAV